MARLACLDIARLARLPLAYLDNGKNELLQFAHRFSNLTPCNRDSLRPIGTTFNLDEAPTLAMGVVGLDVIANLLVRHVRWSMAEGTLGGHNGGHSSIFDLLSRVRVSVASGTMLGTIDAMLECRY